MKALEDLFEDENIGNGEDDQVSDSEEVERRTDTTSYAWESGYNATWATQKTSGGDGQTSCLLFAVRDKDGKVEEIKKLLVDKDRRVRRPYMDTYKYQATQYLQKTCRRSSSIRAVALILDFSESMKEPDLKPSRIACLQSILHSFVAEYFRAGPISQLALFAMTNKDAMLLTPLTGNPSLLKTTVDGLNKGDLEAEGDPSVQAALERASRLLAAAPPHASREIVVVFGSCLTNDAGNMETTVQYLKAEKLRTSVVSLAPEMQILKRLCQETGGEYVVAMNRTLLKEALLAHTLPVAKAEAPKKEAEGTSSAQYSMADHQLIPMGFPSVTSMSTVSFCVCHNRLSFDGYHCPRCQMRSCSVPTTCKACDMALVSAVDVARCQANDATPPPFIPLPGGDGQCLLCFRMFASGGGQCPACNGFVCFDCDLLIHSTLNFCPNCHKNELLQRQGLQPSSRPLLMEPPASWPDTAFLKKVVQMERLRVIEVVGTGSVPIAAPT